MSMMFTPDDLKFLTACGILAEPSLPLDADRLALAQRIAKHEAPAQVRVDLDAARLQLIRLSLRRLLAALEDKSSPDWNPTLAFLLEHNLALTRANYLAVAYLGDPPEELDAEQESELPPGLGQ
jgi:hypothetical protein